MMWKVGLAGIVAVMLIASLTRGLWITAIGQSLACTEEVVSSAAILVENFDPDYLLFERAAALHQAGLAERVLVPVQAPADDAERPNPVASHIAELMGRLARVQNLEVVPVPHAEPYTVNAAYRMRDLLKKEQLRSILLVVPGFRSKRSSLTYRSVLGPAGIQVHCVPVFGERRPENWPVTWHGIQVVMEQWIKLQFYRWYVLWRLPG